MRLNMGGGKPLKLVEGEKFCPSRGLKIIGKERRRLYGNI